MSDINIDVNNNPISVSMSTATGNANVQRFTTVNKLAIVGPATGMIVFDTTLLKLCFFDGSVWRTITSV